MALSTRNWHTAKTFITQKRGRCSFNAPWRITLFFAVLEHLYSNKIRLPGGRCIFDSRCRMSPTGVERGVRFRLCLSPVGWKRGPTILRKEQQQRLAVAEF